MPSSVLLGPARPRRAPALDLELAEARSVVAEIGRADAATAALRARELAERLALVLQASLLVQHAPPAVADAFVRSRIEGRAGRSTAPSVGVDLAAILARA
ncbi:hypothetical protein [Agromyces flavus]|uniref:hypothetical protein n=1 Tax=Agromyces flavus TaxID=589382 RepID=UPI001E62CD66|nr:hypothetical protein [Agromyces flavus]